MHGVFLRALADTVGSVGVITSTLLIRYYGWTVFDPIVSLFIAVLIAASVWPFVQETGRLLGLDLGDEGERQVRSALNNVGDAQGVAGYSAPCFWMGHCPELEDPTWTLVHSNAYNRRGKDGRLGLTACECP